jgi:hypothetical protein
MGKPSGGFTDFVVVYPMVILAGSKCLMEKGTGSN